MMGGGRVVPDDLLASAIEPVGNREGSRLGAGQEDRKPRPRVREKESGEQNEPLEALEVIGATEPHELDEMA
jgi:hypothetical protein